ncbi:MAG: hypothetical protein HXM98_04580 [Porphyromonadaceae bacterium]|nr:hypothetical protein [Porphyromonadaceae bacterium]
MHYTFRYSTTLKVYTALCVMALGLICYYAFRSSPWLMIVLYSWMIFISLLYSALSIPRSIEDDGETVVLRRLLWSKRYSRTAYDISEVSGINLMNGLRVFGSGAYFGYSGYFYKTKIGLFKLLATEDTGHYLRIQRKGSKRPLYIAYRPTQS